MSATGAENTVGILGLGAIAGTLKSIGALGQLSATASSRTLSALDLAVPKVERSLRLMNLTTRPASSTIQKTLLCNSLASESAMKETGTVIAGFGSKTPFRDAEKFVLKYGGNKKSWVKKSSSSYETYRGEQFEIHWVENIKTGQRVEFKTNLVKRKKNG